MDMWYDAGKLFVIKYIHALQIYLLQYVCNTSMTTNSWKNEVTVIIYMLAYWLMVSDLNTSLNKDYPILSLNALMTLEEWYLKVYTPASY